MPPLISVIMSTYNRENIVGSAIESILAQSFSDFEFIIINDNSTDNTLEKLKSYNDKRIVILNNKKNNGCTFNYHKAHNIAKGEYIAHIDDDDISLPKRLEKQYLYMEQYKDIALAGTFIETFGENMRPSWVFYTSPLMLDFIMNLYNPVCHSSVIYRKSFFDKYQINYDLTKKCAQDYDLYKQILFKGGKIANIDEVLVRYRMHKNRLTDIKETQDIQIYNADKTRKELISRFFSDTQTEEILKLTYNFPFNNYKTEDIEKALNLFIQNEKSRKKYKKDLIEEVINNLEEGRFKF